MVTGHRSCRISPTLPDREIINLPSRGYINFLHVLQRNKISRYSSHSAESDTKCGSINQSIKSVSHSPCTSHSGSCCYAISHIRDSVTPNWTEFHNRSMDQRSTLKNPTSAKVTSVSYIIFYIFSMKITRRSTF